MPLISYCPCIGTQRVRGSCALFPDKSSPTGIARSEFCVIFPGEASCRTLALPSQSMRQICATFGASQSPEKETVQAVQRSYANDANENSRRQDPASRHHGSTRYWSLPSHSVVAMELRPDRLHGITGPHDTGHNRHTLWSPWCFGLTGFTASRVRTILVTTVTLFGRHGFGLTGFTGHTEVSGCSGLSQGESCVWPARYDKVICFQPLVSLACELREAWIMFLPVSH